MIARYRMSELTQSEQDRILRRAGSDISAQMEVAREICDTVRREGDTALYAYTEAFDGVRLNPGSMRVTEEEIREATAQVDERTAETLRYAARNIRRFHEAQMPEPMWMMEVDQGIMAGEKVTAIPDVALYVPRGKGSFPSVLLMLGTPAVVAGVARIIVLTPPNEVGKVDPAILFAADLLGIREIYKVGGAQAIAAVAYGTETVPKCAKVLGPGNPYVTAAKRLVMGAIDPGVPAGPSEAIILTDGSVDPRLVAHDVLIEAEHG
ncbi:histidinol dehydrogenase, partial [Ferroacidibacillus organovorans]